MISTKIEAVKTAIPAAVHYTPFSSIDLPTIEYIPLKCGCEAFLNPFCHIDFNRKVFSCPFCMNIQQLPPNYANQISPTMLPKELSTECSTFEFKVSDRPEPNSYLFIIDLCLSEEELEALKKEVLEIVANLPDETYIGIITFHKYVNLYDLPARLNTVFCLNGSKEYQNAQVLDILGLHLKNDPRGICQDVNKKFIVPLGPIR